MSNKVFKKDYSNRANVLRYESYWRRMIEKDGKDVARQYLEKGRTTRLSKKDRIGLLQRLELL